METSAAVIAGILREEIRSGVVLPEAPLNQLHLAARFGVSRVPVREALRTLEAEGLVSQAPHKRARAASLQSPAVVDESLEIRETLEPVLMRHVLRFVDNHTLDRAAAALETLGAEMEITALRGMHGDFHALLYACAKRPAMATIISSHRYRFETDPMAEAAGLRAFIDATRDVHRRLLRACYVRDAAAVESCVREEAAILRAALLPAGAA